jgi:alpha-beta hydrolase superfamily lysophospholipase
LTQFFKKIKSLYQGKKIFVVGDGVGSLILLNLLKEKLIEVDGIILNGPSFDKPNSSKVLSKIS